MTIETGAFQRIYDPSVGQPESWYINDHCFIQDEAGLWHMFGITQMEPAKPLEEVFFAHATSRDLLAPQWKRQAHVLTADASWHETHVWAPHIIQHEGLYYMYYCAGGEDHAHYRIHLATSPDLWTWTRHPANPMVMDGFDGRDPMILRADGKWIMYYTANSTPEGGNHVVVGVTSDDLISWGNKQVVFTHPKTGTYGGPTESPFVVNRNGKYYLFVCTNEPYNTSSVFESESPYAWSIENEVGTFPSHASEVVQDPNDGKWYLSRAGWGQGGLYLATMSWGKSLL